MWTSDLLNPRGFETTVESQMNLETLAFKLNKLEAAYEADTGRKLGVCTSGLRNMADHLRIYRAKNSALKAAGLPEVKVPMESKHLYGQAVDISDPDGALWAWVKINLPLMKEIGLWMEAPDGVKRVHFQIVPPKSGNRVFIA